MKQSTMTRAAVVFALLSLVLIGVNAVQYLWVKNLRATLYERCTDRTAFDIAANEARAAYIHRDRVLLGAEGMNTVGNPEVVAQRMTAYAESIEQAQEAIDAAPSTDCSVYK